MYKENEQGVVEFQRWGKFNPDGADVNVITTVDRKAAAKILIEHYREVTEAAGQNYFPAVETIITQWSHQ